MPKRRKDKKRHIARKIRRLEKRLDYWSSESSDNEDCGDYQDNGQDWAHSSITQIPLSDNEFPISLSNSENEYDQLSRRASRPRSVVLAANTTPIVVDTNQGIDSVIPPALASTSKTAAPSTTVTNAESSSLPLEILEALGDPKGKEEIFGPNIPDEIAERWGRILVDGITKEQKQQLAEKYLIPANFRLAKAPLLNPEIIPVLNEAARHRDKLMEKSQNQLGLGLAELTNLASKVIHEDMGKIEILKNISEISQIFLDLHHEDTNRRRKLITASLDKKFIHMISGVKRDSYLFGSNLGEKIKASKTAERSGLQIKRPPTPATSYKRNPQQGNWRGPPRVQAQRAYKQGGPKRRYNSQQSRRPPPASERPRTTNKILAKSQKP